MRTLLAPGRIGFGEQPLPSLLAGMWHLFALTFPLYCLSNYRFAAGLITTSAYFPIPGVVLMFAILMGFMAGIVSPDRSASPSALGVPGRLLYLFVTYHYLSSLMADNQTLALRDSTKLLIGVVGLYGTIYFLRGGSRLVDRFWTIVVWASALLFAVLIYQQAVVLGSPYLGAHFDTVNRADRNLMLWYLVPVIPFALTYAILKAPFRPYRLVPVFVLSVAAIYGGSRGTWFSLVVGLGCALPIILRFVPVRRLTSATAVFLAIGTVVVTAWVALMVVVPDMEAPSRFRYLFDPNSVPELNSYDARADRAMMGFTQFKRSPIFGAGFTNSGMTHNDYVAVLGDLGIIGAVVFLLLMYKLTKALWPLPHRLPPEILWLSIANRMALAGLAGSLLVINAYSSPVLWNYLGLAFVLTRIERDAASTAGGTAIAPGIGWRTKPPVRQIVPRPVRA